MRQKGTKALYIVITLIVSVMCITLPVQAESEQTVTDLHKDTAYVLPEITTRVSMSSSDVNRIVCPLDIKDVIYSKEKGAVVKISGRNAFVKFLITQKITKKAGKR